MSKKNLNWKKTIDSIIRFIYSFILTCRKKIASYLRNFYSLERLASNYSNIIIYVDESHFTHQQGLQTWVVGLINLDNKAIRLEVVSNRNEATLKQ